MTNFVIGCIIGAVIGIIYMIVEKINDSKRIKKEMYEFRKGQFQYNVRILVSQNLYPNRWKIDLPIIEETTNRLEKYLDMFAMRGILDFDVEDQLNVVNSLPLPSNQIQQLESDIKTLDEIEKRYDKGRPEFNRVFEEVMSKLKFDEWDKMERWQQKILIESIIESMKNRGEVHIEE